MDIPGGIRVHRVGLAWRNVPGEISSRPSGTGTWQFNLFHKAMRLRLASGEGQTEAPAGIWFAPQQPQWYCGAAGGFTDDWLTCSGPLRPLLVRHGVPVGVPFAVGNAAAVEGCLHALKHELDERLSFADEAVADLLRGLVRLLGRGLQRDATRDPHRLAVLALREALRERHAEPWTVARMATEAGLGAHRFAVLYRRATGSTPLHDLTWFRMRHAYELLTAGGSVAATAAACGYTDPLYFSRVFRRWTGKQPSSVPSDRTQRPVAGRRPVAPSRPWTP